MPWGGPSGPQSDSSSTGPWPPCLSLLCLSVAVAIATEVARVYGSAAAAHMIHKIMEAWAEYKEHEREERQSNDKQGGHGPVELECDCGPDGPPQGIDPVFDGCW